MNGIIFCVLENDRPENSSCIIRAIFEQQQGKCNNSRLEYSTYAHSNVSIAHLPRNQILCFVAEANYNSTSTVILVGNFSTPIGIINLITCMHVYFIIIIIIDSIYIATGVIYDDNIMGTTVYQTTVIIAVVVIITIAATIAASMVTVYIVILKRKQRRNSGDSVM